MPAKNPLFADPLLLEAATTLSGRALTRREKMEKLQNLIAELAAVLKQDMDSPNNQNEEAFSDEQMRDLGAALTKTFLSFAEQASQLV